MKIVKRVSLYRAVDRITNPHGSAPKVDHMRYNQTAPWRMTMDMELFKYGYRNKPRSATMGLLAVLSVLLGFTAYST
jgi:hypothetical protein